MKDFKKQFGLIPRMGTKDEISDIAIHLALVAYSDAITFVSNSELSDNAHTLGMSKYLELNKTHFEGEIKDCLFVLDYAKYNVKLFSVYLQYIESADTNKIAVYEMNFFKSKIEFFQMLDTSGMVIDFDKENGVLKKSKKGSLPKPTEESLVKTLYIIRDYDRNRDVTITLDDICKEHNLAKSTYYRVQKWLALNPLIELIDK